MTCRFVLSAYASVAPSSAMAAAQTIVLTLPGLGLQNRLPIWLTVLIVGIAGSAHQGWSANQFSFASDTMPRHAVSTLVGLGGFIAYFTGGFMTEGIGYILKTTGSYASIFAAASVMYLASLLLTHLLVPRIVSPEARA